MQLSEIIMSSYDKNHDGDVSSTTFPIRRHSIPATFKSTSTFLSKNEVAFPPIYSGQKEKVESINKSSCITSYLTDQERSLSPHKKRTQRHVYIDYSNVPPTQQDRKSYANKSRYYKNNHTDQIVLHLPASKEDEITNIDVGKITGAESLSCQPCEQKDEVMIQDGRSQEEEDVLDPQIFKRRGRGNALSLLASPYTPPRDEMPNIHTTSNNIDDGRFIGFMGTNFPARLHDLISKPSFATSPNKKAETDHISSVINWLPHGRSWVVYDVNNFMKSVARTHFNVTQYKSFVRQVNGWGFKRITNDGPDAGSYYHELFLRDMPHLIKYMRRDGKSKSYRAAKSNSSPSSTSNPLNTELANYSKERTIQIKDKTNPDLAAISKKYPIPNHYIVVENKSDASSRSEEKGGRYISSDPRASVQSRRSSWPFALNIHHHQLISESDRGNDDRLEDFSLPQSKKAKSSDNFSTLALSQRCPRQEHVENNQNTLFSLPVPKQQQENQALPYSSPVSSSLPFADTNVIQQCTCSASTACDACSRFPTHSRHGHIMSLSEKLAVGGTSFHSLPANHYQEVLKSNTDSLQSPLKCRSGQVDDSYVSSSWLTTALSGNEKEKNDTMSSVSFCPDSGEDAAAFAFKNDFRYGEQTGTVHQNCRPSSAFRRRHSDERIYSYNHRTTTMLADKVEYNDGRTTVRYPVIANAGYYNTRQNVAEESIVQDCNNNNDGVLKNFIEELFVDENILDFNNDK